MIIYKAQNKVNGKVYIGQTIKTLERRIYTHYYYARKDEKFHFQNALLKYDRNDWEWSIVCECSTQDELNEKEIHYIELYDTYRNGYNMTLGGGGHSGFQITEETRQKMRDNCHNGGYKHPEWMKKKMSEDAMGERNNFYGKNHSEESKRKMVVNRKEILSGEKHGSSEEFVVTTPDNEEFVVKGLRKYCTDNNLNYDCMSKVSRGLHKQHKGYKCQKLE